MLFFDSTPIQRILTQASTGFSVMDFEIPFSFVFMVTSTIKLVTIIIVMASVTWQILIVRVFATTATKYFQIMSQYDNDDQFIADGYEMEDLDDIMEDELYRRDSGSDKL